MSETVLMAMITNAAGILGAAAIVIKLFRSDRTIAAIQAVTADTQTALNETKEKVAESHKVIEVLETNTNSLLAKHLQVSGDAEHAKGKLEGHAEEAAGEAVLAKGKLEGAEEAARHPGAGSQATI